MAVHKMVCYMQSLSLRRRSRSRSLCLCGVPTQTSTTHSRNSFPSPLCFFSSARQGSHVRPYFLISLLSSSFCSFCNAGTQSALSPSSLHAHQHGRKDDATHQVPRHLAAVHLVEHLLDGRLREPLGALVRRALLLLEALDERRLLVLRPPPFGLEVEPEAQDRVVQLLHPWSSDFFDRTRRKPSS